MNASVALPRVLVRLAWAGIAVGIISVLVGSVMLTGAWEARAAFGNVVDTIVWFNVSASILYVAAGVGVARSRGRDDWAKALSFTIGTTTLAVLAGFSLYVAVGRPYEPITFVSLALRSGLWLGIAMLADRMFHAE